MTDIILIKYNLSGGKETVLFDRLGIKNLYKRVEIARKICLLDEQGETVWQVSNDFDSEGNPFTNMTLHRDGSITAYRWDGGNYILNAETGFATPSMLMK